MVTMAVETLVEQERGFWQAIAEHDMEFYRRGLTDDAVVVSPDGITDKQKVIDMMSAYPGYTFTYELEEPTVRELTEDSVLVAYRARRKGEWEGQSYETDVHASTVYVQRHGQWLAAFHQETPVQQSM